MELLGLRLSSTVVSFSLVIIVRQMFFCLFVLLFNVTSPASKTQIFTFGKKPDENSQRRLACADLCELHFLVAGTENKRTDGFTLKYAIFTYLFM